MTVDKSPGKCFVMARELRKHLNPLQDLHCTLKRLPVNQFCFEPFHYNIVKRQAQMPQNIELCSVNSIPKILKPLKEYIQMPVKHLIMGTKNLFCLLLN